MNCSDGTGDACYWAVFSPDGEMRSGSPVRGAPAEAMRALNGDQLVMLVPGPDVLLTTAAVPDVSRRQQEKAVPYALEDRLLADIEDLHFVLGERSPEGCAVAVISRARMQVWLDALQPEPGASVRMVPDVLAVPYPAAGWSVLLLDDRVLVRTGAQTGFSIESDNTQVFMQAALDAREGPAPGTVRVYGGSDEQAQPVKQFCEANGISLERHADEAGPLGFFARGLDAAGAINLLQGAFVARGPKYDAWQRWRVSAFALAGVLLLHMGFVLVDYFRLKGEDARLSDQVEQVYRDAFPDARNVVNPRLQMEQKLKAMQQGGAGAGEAGFLPMLGKLAETVAKVRGANLQRVDFREGRLDLELTVSGLPDLERIKQGVEVGGRLSVQIVSAGKREGHTEARLRITRSAP